jgi:hypothetical protein
MWQAEVGITVEVDSAEGQSIPLFKGLNQNIAVSFISHCAPDVWSHS